jgi:hypothetical protein
MGVIHTLLAGRPRQRLDGAVRAYLDIGSVRGVGLAVLGLVAVSSFEGRHDIAAIVAAAERYMHEQGDVDVCAGDAPGLDLVTQSRDALPATALEDATVRPRPLNRPRNRPRNRLSDVGPASVTVTRLRAKSLALLSRQLGVIQFEKQISDLGQCHETVRSNNVAGTSGGFE